jgi:hypothetical protein
VRRCAVIAGLLIVVVAAVPGAQAQSADPGSGASGGGASGGAGSGGAASEGAGSGGAASGGEDTDGSSGSGAGSSGSGAGSSGSGAGSSGSGAGSSGSGAGDQVLKIPMAEGAPEVRAAASPSVVRLGAHFTLYITATFGRGVEVNLREPVDLGRAFEVRRRLSEDQPSAAGGTTREWQLDVTPWELGDLQLAPIAVTFTVAGRAGQVQTNAVPLRIVGVLGDLVDDPKLMRGLASPTGLTMRDWFWIWLSAAGGAALGVIVVALWARRRRSHRTLQLVGGAIARPRRIDMTGERALERLLAIEQSGVLDRDADRKAGYAEMVEVIRDYLAARYRIAIHDLTSSELIRRLHELAPHEEVELVETWLDGCDLVKYGGARVAPAEAGKTLDDARALIVATTQLRAVARSGAGPTGATSATGAREAA